jgi:hypothetical protein
MGSKTLGLILAILVAMASTGCNESKEPWEKFVNERHQAWPTNGICERAGDEHIGEPHITQVDWEGSWIRITKRPDSSDANPVFNVKVSPGIEDEADWNALQLQYESGDDTSSTPFPICDPTATPEPGAGQDETERLYGILELTHRAGSTTARMQHKVEIFLWQPTTGPDGQEYGPIEIVFKHHPVDERHNGIVH